MLTSFQGYQRFIDRTVDGDEGIETGNFKNLLDMILHGAGDEAIGAGIEGLGGVENNPQTGAGDVIEVVEIENQVAAGGNKKILQLLFKPRGRIGVEAATEAEDRGILLFFNGCFHAVRCRAGRLPALLG